MDRVLFVIGSLSGFLGVALGAFGSHGLRSRLSAEMLKVWETAVQYQMLHALALLAVVFAAQRFPNGPWQAAGWCFVAGTILFSGSLYALSISGIRKLGAITPIGGLLFLVGWVLLGVMAI